MPDLIDLAQEREEAQRAAALARALVAGAGPYPPAPAASRDCRRCGEPIPAERLAAMPSAENCVTCQAAIELEGRGQP